MGVMQRMRRRFGRARDGAAAVEFALIVPWFAWITLGLAEVSLMGLAQTSMDYAMSEVSRDIRTGEVQTAGLSRQVANGYLAGLVRDGLVEAAGTTRARTYRLKTLAEADRSYPREGLDEDRVWRELIRPIVADLPENVRPDDPHPGFWPIYLRLWLGAQPAPEGAWRPAPSSPKFTPPKVAPTETLSPKTLPPAPSSTPGE